MENSQEIRIGHQDLQCKCGIENGIFTHIHAIPNPYEIKLGLMDEWIDFWLKYIFKMQQEFGHVVLNQHAD